MFKQYTNEELRQALWDIYGILGFDQDRDKTPAAVTDIVKLVVEAAKEFRKDYDDTVETWVQFP